MCAAAGDEQQLQELQLMLRTDFLQEVAHTRATQRLNDSTQNNDASLQFAWETIQEQKKEVVRLRAENQELKTRRPTTAAASTGISTILRDASSSRMLESSLFNDEPVNAINLLRSQLSSHHDTNLNILHDYIMRLEDALRRATSTSTTPAPSVDRSRDVRDASGITFDSSRGEEKENWQPFFSASMEAAREDFSRTQPIGGRLPIMSCDQCKRTSGPMISLQSEVKQLRAQVAADEESLVRAEKDQLHLKRENSALTSALLSAKQQQEDLRQMILDVTHEKHELQGQSESEQRASERKIRLLRDQLDALDERNKQQARKLERLELELVSNDAKDKQWLSFRASRGHSVSLEEYDKLSEMNSGLRERIGRLQREVDDCETRERENKQIIRELQSTVEILRRENQEQQRASSRTTDSATQLDEKNQEIVSLKGQIPALESQIDIFQQQRAALEAQASELQRTLTEKEAQLGEHGVAITELKQDKKLLVSLQKVERERSLLHQDELEQAKEECVILKERLTTAIAEFEELKEAVESEKNRSESLKKRFDDADSKLKKQKDANARLEQELRDTDAHRQTLEDHVHAQLELQQETNKCKTSHHVEQLQFEELQNANARLNQEIADSKTTILMWMSKYNALTEQVRRLEEDAQCFTEERYSLQKRIEGMAADHRRQLQDLENVSKVKISKEIAVAEETTKDELVRVRESLTAKFEAKIAELEQKYSDQQSDLAQSKNRISGELAQLRESNLDLENQVSILKDANRGLQHELRSEERQRKTLGFLVQTLQERPLLQRRAFQEMLLSSQRQLEFTFMQLSNRVERVGQKFASAELKCTALKDQQGRREFNGQLAVAVANSSSQTVRESVESSALTLHRDSADQGDASTVVISARYHEVCRTIRKLAASSQFPALVKLAQESASDEDFLTLAEPVLVHALQTLDFQQHPSSSLALQADTSLLHETSLSSQLAVIKEEGPSTDERSTTAKAQHLSTIYLKWRFLISAALLKQQLARKHRAYTRMVTKCMHETHDKDAFAKQAKRWKWKYLAVAVTQKEEREVRAMSSHSQEQLHAMSHQWKWQSLRHRLEAQKLRKTVGLMQLQALHAHKRYQRLQKLCVFTSWRFESKIHKLEAQVISLQQQQKHAPAFSASGSSLSPVSAVALSNCVRLLQKFCDGDSATEPPQDVGSSRESLTKYLIESNSKIASWRRTIDRKIEEFSDRKEQLVRLQTHCNEMKELVALHQRLVKELERKAASHQAIVDAACGFTRAYKTLRSSVSSQMFTTNEFYAACKRVVEVVHAASSVQSVQFSTSTETSASNAASLVLASPRAQSTSTTRTRTRTSHGIQLSTLDEKTEFSSSRVAITAFAASVSSSSPPTAAATVVESKLSDPREHVTTTESHEQGSDHKRRKVNDSNIAILEHAVGSLKSANEIHELLQRALANKTKLLERKQRQLDMKSVQFIVLRSFLRWKCTTYALRLQEESAERCIVCKKQQ